MSIEPPGRNLPRQVIVSTLTNYGAKALTLGVWFFLTPFLVHQLGDSAYGLWVLVGSVVGYGTLLDLGIAPAVTKYVAEYYARGQLEQVRSLVATAVWLYVGLGLVAIIASAALAPLFPLLFRLPPEQHGTASWLVLLAGVGLGLALPSTTTSAVLQGLHRFDLANLIGIIGLGLFTLTTLMALAVGSGLVGMVAVNIPVTLVTQIPAIWLVYRAAPELRFGLGRPRRALVRTVFSFSSALVAVNLASQVQTQTDEIVIGAFLPMSSVTPYAIARRLSALPQVLTNQFVKVLMPLASKLNATADREQLRQLFLTSARLTLSLDVPMVCGLIVLGRTFLSIWVGPAYADATPLLVILALASLIDTSMWPAVNILQGMGRHRPIAIFAIGSGLANLLLSLWLVRPLGVIGVALGTLIPTCLECIFLVTPYVLRVSDVSLRVALREWLAPSLLPAAPMLLTLIAMRELLDPRTYWAIGVIGLVGSGVYALGYLALTRGRPEQILLRRYVGQVAGAVRLSLRKTRPDESVR